MVANRFGRRDARVTATIYAHLSDQLTETPLTLSLITLMVFVDKYDAIRKNKIWDTHGHRYSGLI